MAKVPIHANFGARQQAFLDFVLGHYVIDGVEELDHEKLVPLLALKYPGSLSDAVKELAMPAEDIGRCFRHFQKYLYPPAGE